MAKKLQTFFVPITIDISGHVEVQATTKKQAIVEAKKKYHASKRDLTYPEAVWGPCVDINFAYDDDPESVEDDTEDNTEKD